MNKNVIAAVDAVNKVNQAQVEQTGAALVTSILGMQEQIEQSSDNIKDYQQELSELCDKVITEHSVLGTTLPAEGKRNANEATIAKVIETLNKNKQEATLKTSTRLTEAVVSKQGNIESLNKKIKELREELLKLTADVVRVEQVVNS